jgi:hypothetical protein
MSRKAVAKKQKFADACDIHSHTVTFSLADITGNNIDTPISTFVERASADNRRRYREELLVEPPSPVKRDCAAQALPLPEIRENVVESDASDRYQMGLDDDDGPGFEDPPLPLPRPVPKPSVRVFSPVNVWLFNWFFFSFFFLSRIQRSPDFAFYATLISRIFCFVTAASGPWE